MPDRDVAHPGQPIMTVVSVDQIDDLMRYAVEVEYRRVCVQAGGMKLVTVLHGEFSECSEIFPAHCFNHLNHTVWDDRLGTMLQNTEFYRLFHLGRESNVLSL